MATISVFIPVYNTERFIGKTIDSVIDQTFTDFDLIIVDDCSTDRTYEICKQYADRDSRIKLYRNEHNLGMMANWNRGLELCVNPFFSKLDADDRWDNRMLKDCHDIIAKDGKIGLVFTKYALIDENEQQEKEERELPGYAQNNSFYGTELVKRGVYGMFHDDVLKQGIGLIRRKIFDELGAFSLHDAGDTEMWFRIGAHYKLYGINQTYYYYRVWSSSFTRTQVLQRDKQQRNLFEVRQLIINYYREKSLITRKEYTGFKNDNLFEYNKHLSYTYRREGKIIKSILILVINFIENPFKTISFYIDRLRLRF